MEGKGGIKEGRRDIKEERIPFRTKDPEGLNEG
jgi:hypothetical protein